MVDDVPEDFPDPYLDKSYGDENTKELRWRCRKCRKAHHKANHIHGFVVRSSNGKAILVGSRCGPKHYPDTWGLLKRRWDEKSNRRALLRRLERLKADWMSIQVELSQFNNTTIYSTGDILRSNLSRLPRFENFILTMINRYGGELHIVERIRDLIEEQKLPEDSKTEIYKDQKRSMGYIGGREFLLGGSSLKSEFEESFAKLQIEVQSLSEVGSDLDTKQLGKRFRRVAALFKRVKSAVSHVCAMRSFVDPDHIRRLCLCATDWRKNRDANDHYSYTNRQLVGVEDDRQPVSIPIPSIAIPMTPRFDRFVA